MITQSNFFCDFQVHISNLTTFYLFQAFQRLHHPIAVHKLRVKSHFTHLTRKSGYKEYHLNQNCPSKYDCFWFYWFWQILGKLAPLRRVSVINSSICVKNQPSKCILNNRTEDFCQIKMDMKECHTNLMNMKQNQ